jgi:ribosome-binding protein aMBF1 (putative translation factor)
MTPAARLRAALDHLHWSCRSLAAILGRDERRVRRWAAGDYEPPEDVLAWLERLAAFHDAHPPPARESNT